MDAEAPLLEQENRAESSVDTDEQDTSVRGGNWTSLVHHYRRAVAPPEDWRITQDLRCVIFQSDAGKIMIYLYALQVACIAGVLQTLIALFAPQTWDYDSYQKHINGTGVSGSLFFCIGQSPHYCGADFPGGYTSRFFYVPIGLLFSGLFLFFLIRRLAKWLLVTRELFAEESYFQGRMEAFEATGIPHWRNSWTKLGVFGLWISAHILVSLVTYFIQVDDNAHPTLQGKAGMCGMAGNPKCPPQIMLAYALCIGSIPVTFLITFVHLTVCDFAMKVLQRLLDTLQSDNGGDGDNVPDEEVFASEYSNVLKFLHELSALEQYAMFAQLSVSTIILGIFLAVYFLWSSAFKVTVVPAIALLLTCTAISIFIIVIINAFARVNKLHDNIVKSFVDASIERNTELRKHLGYWREHPFEKRPLHLNMCGMTITYGVLIGFATTAVPSILSALFVQFTKSHGGGK